MTAGICVASVLFGAWLWWRFPVFNDLAGEAGYWMGMVIFAVCWPIMLPCLRVRSWSFTGFLTA